MKTLRKLLAVLVLAGMMFAASGCLSIEAEKDDYHDYREDDHPAERY